MEPVADTLAYTKPAPGDLRTNAHTTVLIVNTAEEEAEETQDQRMDFGKDPEEELRKKKPATPYGKLRCFDVAWTLVATLHHQMLVSDEPTAFFSRRDTRGRTLQALSLTSKAMNTLCRAALFSHIELERVSHVAGLSRLLRESSSPAMSLANVITSLTCASFWFKRSWTPLKPLAELFAALPNVKTITDSYEVKGPESFEQSYPVLVGVPGDQLETLESRTAVWSLAGLARLLSQQRALTTLSIHCVAHEEAPTPASRTLAESGLRSLTIRRLDSITTLSDTMSLAASHLHDLAVGQAGSSLTPADAAPLVQALRLVNPRLSRLTLWLDPALGTAHIPEILRGFPGLKELTLYGPSVIVATEATVLGSSFAFRLSAQAFLAALPATLESFTAKYVHSFSPQEFAAALQGEPTSPALAKLDMAWVAPEETEVEDRVAAWLPSLNRICASKGIIGVFGEWSPSASRITAGP